MRPLSATFRLTFRTFHSPAGCISRAYSSRFIATYLNALLSISKNHTYNVSHYARRRARLVNIDLRGVLSREDKFQFAPGRNDGPLCVGREREARPARGEREGD